MEETAIHDRVAIAEAGMNSTSVFGNKRIAKLCLLMRPPSTSVISMKSNQEERSRYKITDSHRNQTFVGVLRKDRDTEAWTWHGHIDFTDGQNFEFASQRSFSTATEAEEYMRRFACARIDNQLRMIQPNRF